MEDRDYIQDALRLWASTWPRNVTKFQRTATSLPEATELIINSERDPEDWPFISTYSFPDGHTSSGNIPRIDRLFIDMDVPGDGEYRSGGTSKEAAWNRDMSQLLVRVRKVARALIKEESSCWQATLSGHKGIHLDMVFPRIDPANGDFEQFRNGMGRYSEQIVEYLSDVTNISDLDEYVDVMSDDLGRLRRVPNTLHRGASKSFGEERFCVPVTLSELSKIRPNDYKKLTRSRRPVTSSMKPKPNAKAGELLTQQIRLSEAGNVSSDGGNLNQSVVDRGRINRYKKNANDNLTADDINFLMSERPCVEAFVNREDAFSYHSESHLMEMKAITEMMTRSVPIDVMVEYFSQMDNFDESYTVERIEQYVSRSYDPVSCEKMWAKADRFCVKSCDIRKRDFSGTVK